MATKLDPIIAVKGVEASSKWYQSVFRCKSLYWGKEFDVLALDLISVWSVEERVLSSLQNRSNISSVESSFS